MANIQQIFSRVPLQGGSTKAQASYNTPVANAIGQSAQVASQFLQKYQQAQFEDARVDTMLNIQKSIDNYSENQRLNPILPSSDKEDIVSLKEQDWQKFSKNDISNNIISKIKDPKLKDYMETWWRGQDEGYRSKVVESAMDENISYMANRNNERFQVAMQNTQYNAAEDIAKTSVRTGLWSRESGDEAKDTLELQRVLHAADNLNIEDASKMINEDAFSYIDSEGERQQVVLDADKKDLAMKYMKDRKKVQADHMAATEKSFSSQTYFNTYSLIKNHRLETEEDVISYLRSVKDAEDPQYGTVSGSADNFRAKYVNQLVGLIDKGKDGATGNISSLAKSYARELLNTKTRPEIMQIATDLLKDKEFGQPFYDYLHNQMAKGEFKPLNSTETTFINDNIKGLLRDKYITEDEKGVIFDNFNHWKSTYSDDEIRSEAYMNDAPNFFKSYRADKMSQKISQLSAIPNGPGGLGKLSPDEEWNILGSSGAFVGLAKAEDLTLYLDPNHGGNTDKLKNSTADSNYGKPYDLLDKDQQKRVDYVVGMAEYSKSVIDYARQTIPPVGENPNIGEDPSELKTAFDHNGMPIARYEHPDGTVSDYKLIYDNSTKSEVWVKYQTVPETGKSDWYPVNGLTIDPIPRDKTAIEKAGKALLDFTDKLHNPNPIDNIDEASMTEEQRAALRTIGLLPSNNVQQGWNY